MRISRRMGIYAQMPEKILTIYDNGVEHPSGIEAYPYLINTSISNRVVPTLTKGEDEFRVRVEGGSSGSGPFNGGSIYVNNAINLTGKATLNIEVSSINIDDWCYMLVTSQKADNLISAGSVLIKHEGPGVYSVDISQLTGYYYVVIMLGGYGTNSITVKRWWLE